MGLLFFLNCFIVFVFCWMCMEYSIMMFIFILVFVVNFLFFSVWFGLVFVWYDWWCYFFWVILKIMNGFNVLLFFVFVGGSEWFYFINIDKNIYLNNCGDIIILFDLVGVVRVMNGNFLLGFRSVGGFFLFFFVGWFSVGINLYVRSESGRS